MGETGVAEKPGLKDAEEAELMAIKGAELCDTDMGMLTMLLECVEVVDLGLQDAARGLRLWREAAERLGLLDEYIDCRLKFAAIWEEQLRLPSDLLEVVSGVETAVVGYAGDVRQEMCYRRRDEREARREAREARRKGGNGKEEA